VSAKEDGFERLLSGWHAKNQPSENDFHAVAKGLSSYWDSLEEFVAGHPGVVVLHAVLGSDATQPPPQLFNTVLELLNATTWGAGTVVPTVDSTA
jgi:hypothetical protein